MLSETIKNIIRVVFVGVIIGGLIYLGNEIDKLVIWQWLTDFFSLIKKAIYSLDFIIDSETLIKIVGYSLKILIAYWSFKAIIWLSKYFNEQ